MSASLLIFLSLACHATAIKRVVPTKDLYYTQHAYAYSPKDFSRLMCVSAAQKERVEGATAKMVQGSKEACIASVMEHLQTEQRVVVEAVPCAKKVFVFWEKGMFKKAIFVESAKTSQIVEEKEIVLEETNENGVQRLRFDVMRETFTAD